MKDDFKDLESEISDELYISSGIGYIICDLHGVIQKISSYPISLFKSKLIVKSSINDLSGFLDYPLFETDLENIKDKGNYIVREVKLNNEEKYLMLRWVKKVVDSSQYLLLALTDITALKTTKKLLESKDLELKSFFENTLEKVLVIDKLGSILNINQPSIDYEVNQIIGGNFFNGLSEIEKNEFKKSISIVNQTKNAVKFTFELDDDEFKAYTASISPLITENEVYAYTIIIRDTTSEYSYRNEIENSKNRLELALERGQIGLWEWGIKADILELSSMMSNFFMRKTPKDTFGINILKQSIHHEDTYLFNDAVEKCLYGENNNIDLEYRIITKDNDTIFVSNRAKLIRNKNGDPIRMFGVCMDVTPVKQNETELISAIITTQEKERERFGQDLHDGIGQILTAIKLNLNAISLDNEELVKNNAFPNLKILLDKAITDTRNLSHNLLHGTLKEAGLLVAIKELCKMIPESKDLEIVFDFNNISDEERFNEILELNYFRIAQELLSNAINHSGANEIYLLLSHIKGEMILEVRDNGKGFTPETRSYGVGMKNIESRVNHLNGEIEIQSVKEKGTRFIITCSINEVKLLMDDL